MQTSAPTRLTPTQWLICIIAAIGFAFDIYEILMLPLVVRPALLELPATHSLGMAARAALRRLPAYVHVYFHDTDLLDRRRARALEWALRIIGRRRRPLRLDRLEAEQELDFSAAASGL